MHALLSKAMTLRTCCPFSCSQRNAPYITGVLRQARRRRPHPQLLQTQGEQLSTDLWSSPRIQYYGQPALPLTGPGRAWRPPDFVLPGSKDRLFTGPVCQGPSASPRSGLLHAGRPRQRRPPRPRCRLPRTRPRRPTRTTRAPHHQVAENRCEQTVTLLSVLPYPSSLLP